VFAHGSSIESANQAVRTVSAEMSRRGGYEQVETAFLEAERRICGPVKVTVAVSRILLVIPYFLTLGLHLQRDLPRLVEAARRGYPK